MCNKRYVFIFPGKSKMNRAHLLLMLQFDQGKTRNRHLSKEYFLIIGMIIERVLPFRWNVVINLFVGVGNG